MTYDYEKNVQEDLIEYLTSEYDNKTILDAKDNEDTKEKIYEDCWLADCVTGNGSGSYTFSTYKAEENLCHNSDLLMEALENFGTSLDGYIEQPNYIGAESLDVTIRCYILDNIFNDTLEDLQNNIIEELTENIETKFEKLVKNNTNTISNSESLVNYCIKESVNDFEKDYESNINKESNTLTFYINTNTQLTLYFDILNTSDNINTFIYLKNIEII